MHYPGSSNVLHAIGVTTEGLTKIKSVGVQLTERCKQGAQRPGRLPGLADDLAHLVLRLLQHQRLNADVRHLPARQLAGLTPSSLYAQGLKPTSQGSSQGSQYW